MAPNHRKMTFSSVAVLCFLLFAINYAAPLAVSARTNRNSNSQRAPTKRQTSSTTTTTTPVPPGELVYKFYEPKVARNSKRPRGPEKEPEDRELGYYGVYDHIGLPKQQKVTPIYSGQYEQKTLYGYSGGNSKDGGQSDEMTFVKHPAGTPISYEVSFDNKINC